MPLPRSSLLEGLTAADLEWLYAQMQPRHFAAGDVICREGDPGTSLFIVQSGLAQVVIGSWSPQVAETSRPPLARMRPGDVIGEVSLLTKQARSATVAAIVPTDVLELDEAAFATLLAAYPAVRDNLIHILSQRLVRTSAQLAGRPARGEVIGLLTRSAASPLAHQVVQATRAASPHQVAMLEPDPPVGSALGAGVLGSLDGLVAAYATVIVVLDLDRDDLPQLAEHMDRLVAPTNAADTARLTARLGPASARVELVQLAGHRNLAWLGRHLARTKIGLALGAGGAKGYAHIATLHCLEEAGYTVDYVAGSSVGAMVGCWLALGMSAAEIEATMRREHTPEAVSAMFKLSFSGFSSGLGVMTEMCRRTTTDRSFEDLQIPLGVMTVDLDARQPALLTSGPLWQALLAATALPGMFPPVEHQGRRLVDGLALVPVPTDAVRELGADVVISVNLSSPDPLPAWPGAVPREPPARSGARLLDSLLEVMELAQLESGVRHAARADVVLTPRFGPASWRDFHLADLFLNAGRDVAEAQFATLHGLARPQAIAEPQKGWEHGAAVHV
jgi:NTE family protein